MTYIATVYEWLHLKEETASLSERPLNRRALKICHNILKKRISDNPDMLLKDHAAYFCVRLQTISMALQRMGITRKKRRPSTKNKMSLKEPTI